MTEMHIEQVDVDGAIRERAEAVSDTSRAGFFKKMALGAGGMMGGGAALASLTGVAGAATSHAALTKNDIGILQFALTLEYLEEAFYREALRHAGLTGGVRDFAETAHRHEAAHVKAIQTVLGRNSIASPRFDFRGTTASRSTFMKTSQTLENTGVAAYKGQAPNIRSNAVLADAVAIHAVEADHAAWISLLLGETPFPTGAFDRPLTKHQVLAAVKATRFILSD